MASTRKGKHVSRRTVLKGTAAAGAFAAFPTVRAFAAITHRRKSLQGANAAKDVENYKKAVKEMLLLKPENPLNWYRNAITHLFDCPHGNWWFLVWHRGYLGWFERTCGKLCGDESFALPYWDWTKEPKVPDAFWEGVLDPGDALYETSLSAFRDKFHDPVKAQWEAFSAAQRAQQNIRGAMLRPQHRYSNFEEFWRFAELHFFPNSAARTRTQSDPELSSRAKRAVGESKIIDLLRPADFVQQAGQAGFETAQAPTHNEAGQGMSILETEPHGQVHGAIGGLMSAWLSPVDPIFFMHHGNIDRLWDVWARKQQANSRPIGPPAALEAAYNGEDFLFFHEEAGNPAPKTKAGDYRDMSFFNYDYEAGTGENQIPVPVSDAAPVSNSTAAAATFNVGAPASAELALSTPLAERLNAADQDRFFATVSIDPPEDVRDLEFLVFVGRKGSDIDASETSPNYAGAFSFFGGIAHGHGPSTFNIGITDTVKTLRKQGQLSAGDALEVSVVPRSRSGTFAFAANARGTLASAAIGAF